MVYCSILGLALNLAKFNIGSLDMDGAFDAMSPGLVDGNWAREHHSVWVAESAEG